MKFVFPILRMNWYRVMATTIDAALAAGHEVECWHSVGGSHWASNRPCRERLPRFRHGAPATFDYDSDEAFLRLLDAHRPDSVFSLCIPWSDAVCRRFRGTETRPFWTTLTTNDSFVGDVPPDRMAAHGLIALRTAHEEECLVDDHVADVRPLLARMEAEPGRHGIQQIRLVKDRIARPWSTATIAHFRAHAVRTGYPLLDSAQGIDGAEVRRRWELPETGPIVGCLASPYGTVLDAPWEKAFAAGTRRGRLYWTWKDKGWRGLVAPDPGEPQVMRALKRFADKNGAPLVVKMRHTQDAAPWMRKLADRIVGEESYYPHSAVELAAISAVMFGFFTTGAPEAVAAGHPFVNLGIPGYNRETWERLASMFVGLFDQPGAAWTFAAGEWIRRAPEMRLADFALDPAARRAYAHRFCGPLDGRHSARVVRAAERVAAGVRPSDLPRDANGYLELGP